MEGDRRGGSQGGSGRSGGMAKGAGARRGEGLLDGVDDVRHASEGLACERRAHRVPQRDVHLLQICTLYIVDSTSRRPHR
eukprot:8918506-Pyramimonas_sp.AAC.1